MGSFMGQGLGFRSLGFRGLGFRGLGFRGAQSQTLRCFALPRPVTIRNSEESHGHRATDYSIPSAGAQKSALGFRVSGSGFRVQDLGFRVQGLGFRI